MSTQVQVKFESFHPSLIGSLPDVNILLPIELDSTTLREALSNLIPDNSFGKLYHYY